MRWSKLKQRIENKFHECVRGRVAVHSTAYGNCTCGHAWLTLDGVVIANFCTRAFYERYSCNTVESDRGLSHLEIKQYNKQYVEYGELFRQGVYLSCWEYIHDLNFDEALMSDDFEIQALAMLDKRLGKRRLANIKHKSLHLLVRRFLDFRIEKGGI